MLVTSEKFEELLKKVNKYRLSEYRIISENDKQFDIEARVIYAYLKKSLSHRGIQKDILGKDAPARGGGFETMTILHKYDIQKDKKGVLARKSFGEEYQHAKGNYLKALTLLKKYYAEFNSETTNQFAMVHPLNTILYGPPGTGKTFKLKEKYFQQFTLRETSLSKEQFIINLVSDLTWWQTFAIALYQMGTASVDQLLKHEIVKAKASLSKAKNIRPIAWSRMQAHTVPYCPNVNVSDSSEPPLFYKEKDSQWRVVKEDVEQLYPEGIEILEQILNFQPSQDKMVKNYEFVTFHQSYGYEDFVEGIKPKLEDESTKLEYEITEGIFKKLCNRAEKDLDNNYAIFIDEINRGNVSAIFGELITLIEPDKRLGESQELKVKLPYSKTEFGVPPNLFIIGTMNTADRSVEALDTALRRRFVFEEVMPDPKLLSYIKFNGFNLEEVLDTINKRIEALLDRDHTIGHSYFIKLHSGDTAGLLKVFQNNIIPLLQEYFFNDYQKIALVLGPGFIEEKEPEKSLFPSFNGIDEPQLEATYQLIPSIEDIEEAVLACLGKSNE
ncbi:MAG: McrB family protein [Allomuricauda sp.]